jgi:hypothetical protein
MADIRPLLSPDRAELVTEDAIQRAFVVVFAAWGALLPQADLRAVAIHP